MGLFSWFKKPKNTPADSVPVNDTSLRYDLIVPMLSGQSWMDSNTLLSQLHGFVAAK